MSASPVFTSTPRIGAAAVSVANTARDGTGTLATIITAVANIAGTRVWEIAVQTTGDPADSVLTLFLHDGTNFYFFDEIDLGDPAAASATVPGFRTRRAYENLVLPQGWSIRAGITVALTAGVVNVFAFGGDYT